MKGRLENFIKEPQIIKKLLDPRNRLIMVIGGADTGKTTLIEYIAALYAEQTSIGIVDLDMGQSHIGLPTTIAWGKIKGRFRNWDISLTTLCFKDFPRFTDFLYLPKLSQKALPEEPNIALRSSSPTLLVHAGSRSQLKT